MDHDDDTKKRQGRPATKFIERPKPQHPENRPSVDDELVNPGGDAAFEEPEKKKMPDPNWQEGPYTQREKKDQEREGSGE